MIDFREAADRFIKEPLKKLSFFKRYISVKTAVVSLAVLIAAALLFTGFRIIPGILEKDHAGNADNEDLVEIDIDISDFRIPEEITSLDEFKWEPYRGVREKWDEEDAAEFWIPPEETVRKAAEEKNDRFINELFESVP